MALPRRLLLASAYLALIGCVSTRAPLPVLAGAQAQAALAGLQDFQFEARSALRRDEQAVTVAVHWKQQRDDVQVKLSGPFGAGALKLAMLGGQFSIDDGRTRLEGAPAREALAAQLGFDPPLEMLRWWLRGMPAPGQVGSEQRDEQQRLTRLEQDGWVVQFQEYRSEPLEHQALSLPRRLRATRENLDLRLVIDRWKLMP